MNRWLRFVLLATVVFLTANGYAQLSLSNSTPVVMDFNSTITGVSNSTFTAAGFQSSPTSGQLNSDAWAVTGWSDGALTFGGTRTTASTDYTRGNTAIAITTGGIYAFTGTLPSSGVSPCLMIQPGGSDWAPGTITLKIKNTGSTNITSLAVSYNLYVRNDQGRGNSFNFSYSTDDISYSSVSALDYTSTATLDALGIVKVTSPSTSTTISSLSIAPNAFIYIRWSGADVSGSGSRDEFYLDDISLTATFAGSSASYSGVTSGAGSEPATISSLVNAQGAASLSFDFTVTDDANTSSGNDALPTLINQIVIAQGTGNDISDWTQAIAGAELNDGTNSLTGTITSTGITFSSINTATLGNVSDGGTKTYTLKVWLKTSMGGSLPTTIDGLNLAFKIDRTNFTTASGSTSTQFESGTGTAVESGNTNNAISVVATQIAFGTPPGNAAINTNLSGFTVKFTDANGNLDFGTNRTVTLAASGGGVNMSPSSPSQNITAPHTGVVTFSSVMFTSGPQTSITITASSSGFTNVTSGTFNITNFVYLSGDYRPSYDYSDFSINGGWDSYNGSTWTIGVTAPQNLAVGSRPSRIVIDRPGIGGAGSSSNKYNDIVIASGGELILVDDATTPSNEFLNASKKLEIQNGGVLRIQGDIDLPSTANFNIKSGGKMYINQSSITNDHVMWDGDENFESGSIVEVNNWNFAASATVSSIINVSSSCKIDDNVTGYRFGNFIFNATPSTTATLVGGGITVNFCENDLTVTNGSSNNLGITSNANNPVVTINGNIGHTSGPFSLSAGFSGTINQTVHVNGNITSAGTLKTYYNGGGTPGTLNINLKGNLTASSSFSSDNTGVKLNFTGTSAQLLDVSPNADRIAFYIKSGATVRLSSNNLKLNTGGIFTVETGGILDFNWNGSNTPLLITQPTSPSGTNTFSSQQGSTLYITSADGISLGTANLGNVQLPVSNKSFTNPAYFYYVGKTNQVTGDGMISTGSGKVVVVNLLNNSTTLTLTNNVGISNGTTIEALGGRLEIQKGTVIGTVTGDFTGSGRLVMTDGTYKMSETGVTLPLLTNFSQYSLTGGTIELNGAGAQTLSGTPTSYHNIKISGSNTFGVDEKTISSSITINNNFSITSTPIFNSENLGVTGNAGFTMDGGRWRFSKITTLPELTATAVGQSYSVTGGTLEYYGTSSSQQQTIRGTDGNSNNITYYSIDINATGANTANGNVNANASFAINGAMAVYSPAVLKLNPTDVLTGSGTFELKPSATLLYGSANGISSSGATGNIRVNGTRTFPTTSSYGFTGSGNMITGSGLPATVVNLYMVKTNASDLITLTNSVTISTSASFTKGILTTGSNKTTISAGGTVTGASSSTGWVNGNLEKNVATGSNVARTYEIGDASKYTQVTLTFASVSSANNLTTSTTSGDHPNISTSGVISTKSVNRYWKLTNSGVAFTNYTGVFNFVSTDLDASANTSKFVVANYNNPNWTFQMVGTRTSTSTQITGATTFGEFQIGEGGYIWTGLGANDFWNTSANWVGNLVPVNGCSSNVFISAGTPRNPKLVADVNIGEMELGDNKTLDVQTYNLSVCSGWTGGTAVTSTVTGTGKVILNGSSAQQLNGVTAFQTLRLNNSSGAQMQSSTYFDIYKSLELQSGAFNVNGQSLTFKSQSVSNYAYLDNFSFASPGSISGSVRAELTIPVSGTNQHFIGSPVSAGVSLYGANGTAGYVTPTYIGGLCDESKSAVGGPYGNVFSWEENKPLTAPGGACPLYGWKVETSGAVVDGKGYSVYLPGGTFSFAGVPNQGDLYAVSGLANTGYSLGTVQNPATNTYTSGWQLLGNPYLAPYDIRSSMTASPNTGKFDDLAVWVASGRFSGTYQSLMGGGGFNGGVLAPFQGVMIHRGDGSPAATSQSATSFEFNTDYLSVPVSLPQFTRQISQNQLSIEIAGNGFEDVTYVEFNTIASSNFDIGYDSRKMMSRFGQPTVYTLLNGEVMSSSINQSIEEVSTIPLNTAPGADGTFTLTFNGISSFDPTSYIFLEDKTTGVYQDMRSQNTYTFSMNQTDAHDRFILHFTPAALITTADATCNSAGMLNIEQPGSAQWQYVVNSNGTTISSGNLNNTALVTLSVPAGDYVITLTDANGYSVTQNIQVSGAQPITAQFSSNSNGEEDEVITFISSTPDAATYLWDFGDGTIDNQPSIANHQYSEEGVYTVTLTVTNQFGCSSSVSKIITVTAKTISGINNLNENRISIWSNGNKVFVDFSKLKFTNAEIDIFNILGQQLSRAQFGGKSVYSKQLDNLGAGYVIVGVKNEKEKTTKKLFLSGE